MKAINPSNISPQQIEIFIAAAESENFSHAAKIINVSQPLVSQTISTLETQLGMELFWRNSKKISLRPEGRVLLYEWKKIYSLMIKSIEKAHSVSQMASCGLHLISPPHLSKTDFMFPLIDNFKKNHPDVCINVEETETINAVSSVQNNTADIGFTILSAASGLDAEKFCWERLYLEPHYADVPVTLRMSDRTQLTIKDLENVPIALLDPSLSSPYMTYNNDILQLFKDNGISPKIHSYSRNLETLILQSEFANAVVILSSILEKPFSSYSKRIPLVNCNKVGPVIFWNANTENKNVALFVSFSVGFFKKHGIARTK